MNLEDNKAPENVTERNQTWENNHTLITKAIARRLRKTEIMPTVTEIAEETGLSRQTIHKHAKAFGQEKMLNGYLEQFKFMSSKVLSKLLEQAMDGNLRATRLMLELTGILGKKGVEPKEDTTGADWL